MITESGILVDKDILKTVETHAQTSESFKRKTLEIMHYAVVSCRINT